MTPHRYGEGAGGKGIDPCGAALPRPACRDASKHAAFPAAGSQTPLAAPCLYRIHTFVCHLYRLSTTAYKALKGLVATCA